MDEKKQTKDIIARFTKMQVIRKPHESRMKAVCEYLLPNREILMQGINKKGMVTHQKIYDGTPTYYYNMMCNGLIGYTASAAYRWFRKRMANHKLNDISEVKTWLQDSDAIHYAELQNSNFYTALGQYVRDGGSVGLGGMEVSEDLSLGELFFHVLHPWELYIARNEKGIVDTVFRENYMTARNAVKFFKDEKGKLSKDILKDAKDNPEKEHKFLNAMFPADDYTPGLMGVKGKPVTSVHIDLESGKRLRRGGYWSLPIIIWCWLNDSGEVYPRSPGSDALRDIMMMQQMSRTNMVAGQKMSDPPMRLPLEDRGLIDLNPGGESWYEGDKPREIAPILTSMNVPITIEMIQRVDEIIKQHFFVDVFMALITSERQKTKYETQEIQGEKFPMLAPITGQFYHDGLDRILTRSFEILYRAGKMPPLPPILEDNIGAHIEVDYLGPLAQKQRQLFKSEGIIQSLGMALPLAATVPSAQKAVEDRIYWDETIGDILEGGGMPEKNIRPMNEVEERRAAREKLIQKQQAIDNMEKLAGAAGKASKKVEPGSPVEEVMEATSGASGS